MGKLNPDGATYTGRVDVGQKPGLEMDRSRYPACPGFVSVVELGGHRAYLP